MGLCNRIVWVSTRNHCRRCKSESLSERRPGFGLVMFDSRDTVTSSFRSDAHMQYRRLLAKFNQGRSHVKVCTAFVMVLLSQYSERHGLRVTGVKSIKASALAVPLYFNPPEAVWALFADRHELLPFGKNLAALRRSGSGHCAAPEGEVPLSRTGPCRHLPEV